MSSPIKIPIKQLRKDSIPLSPTTRSIFKLKRPDIDFNGNKMSLDYYIFTQERKKYYK